MADTEVRKHLRLRIIKDDFMLPSESGHNMGLASPRMSTNYSGTSQKSDASGVRQGWFPEDWLTADEVGTLKRLGSSSTKSMSGKFPSGVSGTDGLFTSQSGNGNAVSDGFVRTGELFGVKGDGKLTWAVGVTAKNKARLNERACYDTAVGLMMSYDTSNTDYSDSSKSAKFNDIFLLYMKLGDSSTTYYCPLVQDNKLVNDLEGRTSLYEPCPIGKRIDSNDKDNNWNKFPHIGGSFGAYVTQSDIDILAGGEYRCTGILWSVNFSGEQSMHFYDMKMMFVDSQENHKRNNSLKIIQVPQSFADTFKIDFLELARAPEHSIDRT